MTLSLMTVRIEFDYIRLRSRSDHNNIARCIYISHKTTLKICQSDSMHLYILLRILTEFW
jgi:hypothetical protein